MSSLSKLIASRAKPALCDSCQTAMAQCEQNRTKSSLDILLVILNPGRRRRGSNLSGHSHLESIPTGCSRRNYIRRLKPLRSPCHREMDALRRAENLSLETFCITCIPDLVSTYTACPFAHHFPCSHDPVVPLPLSWSFVGH